MRPVDPINARILISEPLQVHVPVELQHHMVPEHYNMRPSNAHCLFRRDVYNILKVFFRGVRQKLNLLFETATCCKFNSPFLNAAKNNSAAAPSKEYGADIKVGIWYCFKTSYTYCVRWYLAPSSCQTVSFLHLGLSLSSFSTSPTMNWQKLS